MDKVKDYLAIACLAYGTGDADFAVRSFLKGMDEATASGEQGLQQVVEFLRAPVAQLVTNVPAAENTMAPALHSDTPTPEPTPVGETPVDPTVKPVVPVGVNPEEGGVNEIGIVPAIDPMPAPITEPVPSTISALSSSMVDDGDEELEARAEAEDEIDDDSEEDEDEDDSEDEEEEEEEEGMKLSISSSTPLRLRQG